MTTYIITLTKEELRYLEGVLYRDSKALRLVTYEFGSGDSMWKKQLQICESLHRRLSDLQSEKEISHQKTPNSP